MIDPNFIQAHVQELVNHIMHMDKESLIQCIYPFWLYILMDGATRTSSRRRAYARR
jgi:hypothetical protein